MTKRPWNDGGAETRFWGVGRTPWYPRPDWWAPFPVAKLKNTWKHNQTIMLKASTPKHQHWCRKGAKKGDNIDAKNISKNIAITSIGTYHEKHLKTCFRNGKIIQIIVKALAFEGLTGCVRKRKMYPKTNQTWDQTLSQIGWKSMRKRCSKKWCRNNGKLCEHGVQKVANI